MQGYPGLASCPVCDAVIFLRPARGTNLGLQSRPILHRLCERKGILFTRWIADLYGDFISNLERAEVPVFLFGR